MSTYLFAFRSRLASNAPKALPKCGDTGDTRSQEPDLSPKIMYHAAEHHGDTGDTTTVDAITEVEAVSPAELECDTGKSPQNRACITCITRITENQPIAEQIAEWRAANECQNAASNGVQGNDRI